MVWNCALTNDLFYVDFVAINFCLPGVEPWTFEQHLGDAVFVPAGCPHQVRNRKVIKLLVFIKIKEVKLVYISYTCSWCERGESQREEK